MDLGKPTPSAGIIRVDFLPLRHNVPTPGVTYEARVAAIGPGGSTASTVSNGFSFQGACAPNAQLHEAVGGRRRDDGKRRRDGRDRLHVVCGVERELDHADRRDQRLGQWNRAL